MTTGPANLRDRPDLDALLKATASYRMTPAEICAQARSWAIGETALAHPDWSRERCADLVDRILGESGLREAARAICCGCRNEVPANIFGVGDLAIRSHTDDMRQAGDRECRATAIWALLDREGSDRND